MINIKTASDILKMKKAGGIAKGALRLAGEMIKPGVSTKHIDAEVRKFIESHNAKPSFLGYGGFPASLCISLNAEVIHGIPKSGRVLAEGDLVKIDVGAYIGSFHGDCADTFYCGDESKTPDEMKKLTDVTRQGFLEGIKYARAGCRTGDIGAAIQEFVESNGFSVVRGWQGHGIGKNLHESPDVPNFGTAGKGARLARGMVIAIEPMVNAGGYEIATLSDKWTVVTKDGKLSAHYENTVHITDGECEILTV